MVLHFSNKPTRTSLSPNVINFATGPKTQKLTISGSHLDPIDSVVLTDPDKKDNRANATIAITRANRNYAQITVPLDSSDLATLDGTTASVTVTLAAKKAAVATNDQNIDFTGAKSASTATPT